MKKGEHGRRKATVKNLLVIASMFFVVMFLGGCKDEELDMDAFSVTMDYGYGDNLLQGRFAPFTIEVTNEEDDFRGTVQLIIPNEDGNTMYEKELALAANTSKSVTLVGEVPDDSIINYVNVRLVDSRGKVIWKDLFSVKVENVRNNVYVGVLSDDYSALSYMDRQAFPNYPDQKTKLFELTEKDFPENAYALDLLDVIVISDFSTDLLSDEQMSALNLWVSRGGLLLVGTGSTYNKTLSKLNHNLFEVEPGQLKKYSTKFGMTMDSQIGTTDVDLDEVPYASDNYEYRKFFTDYYSYNQAELEAYYLENFLYWYGFTREEYEAGVSELGDDLEVLFEEFCYEEYYYEFYIYGSYLGKGGYSYVTVDVIEFDGEFLEAATPIWGENEDFNDFFKMGYMFSVSDGNVILATVDFTKNPLTTYEGNSEVFISLIQNCLTQKLRSAGSSASSYNYFEPNLLSVAGGAKVPPSILYLGLFAGYLISVLVFYLVMRKKGKTFRLWILYPIVAFGLAVLIYCVGFSTRVVKPLLNIVTVLEMDGNMISQTSGLSVTVPKKGEHLISISNDYSVRDNKDNNYMWTSSNQYDYDSYTSAFIEDMDAQVIKISNVANLDSRKFLLQKSYATDKSITIKENGAGYEVTNHYGCDLEAAYIYRNEKMYYIGNIKSGQTVTTEAGEKTYVSNISEEIKSRYWNDAWGASLSGLFFGSLSPAYENYLMNLAGIEASEDYVTKYNNMNYSYSNTVNDQLIFVACPKKKSKGIYQETTNHPERTAEIICTVLREEELFLLY